MWNIALICSNKNHGLHEKNFLSLDFVKIVKLNVVHMKWGTDVYKKRSVETKILWRNSFLKKFYIMFYFLSVCVVIYLTVCICINTKYWPEGPLCWFYMLLFLPVIVPNCDHKLFGPHKALRKAFQIFICQKIAI